MDQKPNICFKFLTVLIAVSIAMLYYGVIIICLIRLYDGGSPWFGIVAFIMLLSLFIEDDKKDST